MAVRMHLLVLLSAILLSALVQAQGGWPWGDRNGDRDDDKEDGQGSPKPPWQTGGWPFGPGNGGSGGPPWLNGGGPWGSGNPKAPWGGQTTVTQQPSPWPTQTRRTTTVVGPIPSPWTGSSTTRQGPPPTTWGPTVTFGPSGGTPTAPQTIPTTTTEAPKPRVPFLTICGPTRYSEYDVHNAILVGCGWVTKIVNNGTVYKSGFPKQFVNHQGISFDNMRGPFWEYPLILDGAYIANTPIEMNPPGPDRVVFNYNGQSTDPTGKCQLAGELTTNGANGRGFIPCKENY